MVLEDRSWYDHKIVSDLLWKAYMEAVNLVRPDMKARKAAISQYLGESTDYWGWDEQKPPHIEGRYMLGFDDKSR